MKFRDPAGGGARTSAVCVQISVFALDQETHGLCRIKATQQHTHTLSLSLCSISLSLSFSLSALSLFFSLSLLYLFLSLTLSLSLSLLYLFLSLSLSLSSSLSLSLSLSSVHLWRSESVCITTRVLARGPFREVSLTQNT